MPVETETFPIKRGDFGDRIVVRCSDRNGRAPVTELTEFRFLMKPAALGTGQPTVSSPLTTIVASTETYVDIGYVFRQGDTDIAGVYRAEIQATFVDGTRATFPSRDWLDVLIADDLG